MLHGYGTGKVDQREAEIRVKSRRQSTDVFQIVKSGNVDQHQAEIGIKSKRKRTNDGQLLSYRETLAKLRFSR